MANEDFEFTRDWLNVWKDAKSKKNIDELDKVFHDLAGEIGLVDPTSDASQREKGKRAAEYMNNISKQGKKV